MPVADALKLTCATCGQANRVPAARLADAPKCGVCGSVLVDGKGAELDPASPGKVTRGNSPPAGGRPNGSDAGSRRLVPSREVAAERWFAEAASGPGGRSGRVS